MARLRGLSLDIGCGVVVGLLDETLWRGIRLLSPRAALEGRGPQSRPQGRLDRRLEEVAKAVGGGYCRLQMTLRLALGISETVAGHRLGARDRGGAGLCLRGKKRLRLAVGDWWSLGTVLKGCPQQNKDLGS